METKSLQSKKRKIYLEDCPEIILLGGGVNDGGDSETVLHNAKNLAESAKLATYAKYGIPIIYAGNEDITEDKNHVEQKQYF